MSFDLVVDASLFAKVSKVGATTHADMLAVVDKLAGGGIQKRTRPASELLSAFQQGDALVGLPQSLRGSQSRQSRADD